MADHFVISPVALPLVVGATMLFLGDRRELAAALNIAATLALAGISIALLAVADSGASAVSATYRLGDWPAPFAIVLVLDRLSAMMVLLTGVLACAVILFSVARWHRAGPHFHALFQFLLMGVNGAFLTGDLFNLFVFFELVLAASYGLGLHGSGVARVKAGLHYIAVNLAASLLFLIGVSLLYGVSGTLNMADLASSIPTLPGQQRALLEAGAAILGVAFLIKAGMWPLCFWLAPTYVAAAPPVAAMFALLTKVGAYIVLRLWLLLFGAEAGPSAGFGGTLLVYGGLATVLYGTVGALAAQDMARIGAFCVVVSSGTVLAATGLGNVGVTGGALFYLISSTLGISAFFLLSELANRGREPGANMLALTREVYGDDDRDEEQEEVGIVIPATLGILGLAFIACAAIIAGMPPLSGFIGKFAILTSALNPVGLAVGDGIPGHAWALLAVVTLSGAGVFLAMTRAGIRAFWASTEWMPPRVRVIEIAPVVALLTLCAAQTIEAGPVMRFLRATAEALHAPQGYIDGVLGNTAEKQAELAGPL